MIWKPKKKKKNYILGKTIPKKKRQEITQLAPARKLDTAQTKNQETYQFASTHDKEFSANKWNNIALTNSNKSPEEWIDRLLSLILLGYVHQIRDSLLQNKSHLNWSQNQVYQTAQMIQYFRYSI